MTDTPEFDLRRRVTAGIVEEVAPGLRRLTATNDGPHTFTGTNSYIVGRHAVAIIDPGPDDPGHLQRLTEAVAGERVSHILVTHSHLDHSALAPALKDAVGAPVLAFGRHGEGRASTPTAEGPDAGADLAFVPDQTLAHGDTVEGPGWRLEALHTPGHTANHLCFALSGRGELISGDHVMGWSTTMVAPPDGDMGAYLNSLRLLLERDDTRYWPAHGGPIDTPARYVRALLDHRKARAAAIVTALGKAPGTALEIAQRIYGELEPKLMPAATLTTLAHLIDLSERGLAQVNGRPSLDAVFSAAGSDAP